MDELLTGWCRIAWAQCWQVTLLIAGVWLVLLVVGRNRPHLACVLWLVVLVKCVTPPVVSSPSGIFCWLQRAEVRKEDGDEPTFLATAVPEVQCASGTYAATEEDAVVVQVSPTTSVGSNPLAPAPTAPAGARGASQASALLSGWFWSRLVWAAALTWLAGTPVFGAVVAWRWLACWRKLRSARRIDDQALAQVVDTLRVRLRLRRPVRLLVTDSPLGPAVVGLWRPAVILPVAIRRGKSPAELEPLLAHELIHIRRGDLWIGLLQTLALGLWWFHPLVRLASRLVTREAERCCDEETIAHLGCDPAAYARSLLDVLALRQQLSPIPAFPGVRPVDVTSQRLERIMKLGQGCHKRTPWWCWLIMLAVAAAVLPGAGLVVGAKEKPQSGSRRFAAEIDDSDAPAATRDAAVQLAIEVRIISGPKAVLNAAEFDWRMIGGTQGEESLPSDQRSPPTQLHPAGTAQVRLVDDDSGTRELASTAVSVIEKSVPAMLALVDDAQAKKLIEAAQSDRRTNIVQAPKITLSSGQSSRIEDLVQRPFVVGVMPVPEVDKTALKPNIKVISEGTTIRLRPVTQPDGRIALDFGLTLSSIRSVDTADFPTGPGKEPITVQVPEVASTRLNTTVEMNPEQTLAISIPKTANAKKVQQPLCVLVKLRKLQAQPAAGRPQEAAKATPQPEEQARVDRQSTEQFAFESSGWRMKFTPIEGGRLNVEQAGGKEPFADVRIRGGVKLDAVRETEEKKTANRISATADAVLVNSQPATADTPARLQITLDGNVRLMHNESRIEAKRIILQIDGTFGGRKPATITMQVDDARSIDVWSNRQHPVDAKHTEDGAWIEKVYPVADLVIPMPSGPIKISPAGSPVKREPPTITKPEFDSLIELITTTIRPDSWHKAGGQGEISVTTNSYSLVIRQDEPVHNQIAHLLHQLRRLQDVQVVLTLQRLQVPAAELEKAAAGNADSPLRPLVEDVKSRVWCLKLDSISKLKGMRGAKLHSGPKVTTFNGQSVELWLVEGEQQQDDLLTGLSIEPVVTSDFRSLRLQVFGDSTPSAADETDANQDKLRSSLDLASAQDRPSRTLPMELRELALGQVLVVDESQFAWQEREKGVPVLDKVPYTARLFKNASANKPDTRHFYLITPNVLVVSEQEAVRVAAPRKE